MKKIYCLCSALLLILLAGCVDAPESAGNKNPPEAAGEAPMGPPPEGSAAQSARVSLQEGNWSFDRVTVTENGISENYAVITYYAGKIDGTVIIPSVLGGAEVREIGSQAFGHHGEIAAVYVPSTVKKAEDWAFYDLNEAVIISFANPQAEIAEGAFQSSGNALLYLPEGTATEKAGGKEVVSEGTEIIGLTLENISSAAQGGGGVPECCRGLLS